MAEEVKPIKTERIDNPDGTYTIKEIYDKPNFGYYLSNIETFDSLKNIYHKTRKEYCSSYEYYDKDDKLLKESFFKDKECSQLYATDTYEYLKNKTVIRKTIFEEMHENHLSGIEYSNKKEEVVFCKSYIDNDFKNLYRKTWVKYNRKGKILLRIYVQKQDGFYSEIEKYDISKNLICKKQYKFKGILAHILFWLTR